MRNETRRDASGPWSFRVIRPRLSRSPRTWFARLPPAPMVLYELRSPVSPCPVLRAPCSVSPCSRSCSRVPESYLRGTATPSPSSARVRPFDIRSVCCLPACFCHSAGCERKDACSPPRALVGTLLSILPLTSVPCNGARRTVRILEIFSWHPSTKRNGTSTQSRDRGSRTQSQNA